MIEVFSLSFAFVFGMLVRRFHLPPLVGFLAAGFALNAWGPHIGLPANAGPVLEHVAHLGVLLLLFTVGLKLKLRQLLEVQVVSSALLHFGITVTVFSIGLYFLLAMDGRTAVLLAIALAFSSTVLAAKVLEAKRELGSFHGRTAIGILIIQDLIALAVLSVAGGHAPSWWALLVFALPLLRPLLHRLLDIAGHDELLVLTGMVLAVVVGGMGFELVGLSPEVGALLMGVMLSDHPRAKEVSDSLWGLKEVLLIGFFLQIGMAGLPDTNALLFALAFALILPLKGLLFFFLLTLFRLRARNAFLGALSLTCYSEFGLIVAAGVLEDWLVPLAITVAVSFVISAPLNRLSHPLFERLEARLSPAERPCDHPDDQPEALGSAHVLVFGMGRSGTAAYDALEGRGMSVLALEANPDRVEAHEKMGRNIAYADAEDTGFWSRINLAGLEAVILALPDLESKLRATRELRKHGFGGKIVTHCLYEDEARQAREAGADEAYLTMAGAGMALADYASDALKSSGKH